MLNHTSFIKGSRKKKLTVLGDMSTKALSPPPPLCLNEHMRKKCVRRHSYKNNLKMSLDILALQNKGEGRTHISFFFWYFIFLSFFYYHLFFYSDDTARPELPSSPGGGALPTPWSSGVLSTPWGPGVLSTPRSSGIPCSRPALHGTPSPAAA